MAQVDHNLSPYHYCNNNPVGGTDPTGLSELYDPIFDGNGNIIQDNNGQGAVAGTVWGAGAFTGHGGGADGSSYSDNWANDYSLMIQAQNGNVGALQQWARNHSYASSGAASSYWVVYDSEGNTSVYTSPKFWNDYGSAVELNPDLNLQFAAYKNGLGQEYQNSASQGGWAVNASMAVLGFIGTDTAIPDPTDLAWPKWAAYAVAGGTAAAIIYMKGNPAFPGPHTYTIPDPTDPFYNNNSSNNYNWEPSDIPPNFPWVAGVLTGTALLLSEYSSLQELETPSPPDPTQGLGYEIKQDATRYYIGPHP